MIVDDVVAVIDVMITITKSEVVAGNQMGRRACKGCDAGTDHPAAERRRGGRRPVTADQRRETDDQDLAGLFRRHHVDLVRLAVLLVHDQPAAEDVVLDVFARLHARPDQPARPGEELAYLRAAVLNGCRSVLRRRAVARRARRWQENFDSWGDGPSAEAEAIKAEDREQVLRALAALPSRRREVLVLRYFAGLSEAEIATTLGVSAGTVKSAAARGIAALARALGEES